MATERDRALPQQYPARCFVSNRILRDAAVIGRMHRDDGWVFLAGDEDQAYLDDPTNMSMCAVDEMVGRDAGIAPYLVLPEGADLVRVDGRWLDADSGRPAIAPVGPPLHPGFPAVHGHHQLTSEWSMRVSEPMNRRVDDGTLVLWRPGLTFRFGAWSIGPGETPDQRLASVISGATRRFDERRSLISGAQAVTYRVLADGGDNQVPSLYAVVVTAVDHLMVSVQFDDEGDAATAYGLVHSLARGHSHRFG